MGKRPYGALLVLLLLGNSVDLTAAQKIELGIFAGGSPFSRLGLSLPSSPSSPSSEDPSTLARTDSKLADGGIFGIRPRETFTEHFGFERCYHRTGTNNAVFEGDSVAVRLRTTLAFSDTIPSVQCKTVTISLKVTDQRGGVARDAKNLQVCYAAPPVAAPPPPPPPQPIQLSDINFGANSARVNNCATSTLDCDRVVDAAAFPTARWATSKDLETTRVKAVWRGTERSVQVSTDDITV